MPIAKLGEAIFALLLLTAFPGPLASARSGSLPGKVVPLRVPPRPEQLQTIFLGSARSGARQIWRGGTDRGETDRDLGGDLGGPAPPVAAVPSDRMVKVHPALVATLAVLMALVLCSGVEVGASLVLFNSNSGATKPQKAKHKDSCPPSMVEATNAAFKHALKKEVYESKKPQSVEAFERLNFSTCAVVGNGGTLQTTKYGKSIDSHEVVFRANQAPVKRYEDKVGSKTTFRILNKRWLGTYSAGVGYLPLERGVFLVTSRGDQKVIDTLYRKHKENPKVNVITMSSKISGASRKVLEEFKDYVKCHKRGKTFHGGSTISSGLFEVFMALSLCDKVTVYGFGNGGHGLYQYYKFRNTERKTGDSVHSFDAEKALVMQLER